MRTIVMTLLALGMVTMTYADDIAKQELANGHMETRTVAKSGDARYYAFPSICRLKTGELLCVFFDGTAHICPDSRISMVRSSDNGKTWSAPEVIVDTPNDDRDPSIMQTKSGRILVNFFTRNTSTNNSAKETNKVCVAASDDGGKTFGPAKKIGTDWLWEATSDEILQLADGTLLLPFYGPRQGDKTWAAGVAFSKDDGATWNQSKIATVAYDEENGTIRYEEPALVLAGKTVICCLRTTNAGQHIYEARSTDGGKTWTKAKELPLFGQASGLLRHSSGVLFHAYRHRSPEGKTLGVTGLFADPNKPWDPEKQFSLIDIGGDVAYPSSVELPDRSILTVYYAREHRAIEAMWISPAAIKVLK